MDIVLFAETWKLSKRTGFLPGILEGSAVFAGEPGMEWPVWKCRGLFIKLYEDWPPRGRRITDFEASVSEDGDWEGEENGDSDTDEENASGGAWYDTTVVLSTCRRLAMCEEMCESFRCR